MGLFAWIKTKSKDNVDFGRKVSGIDDIKKTSTLISDVAKGLLNPKQTIEKSKKESFSQAKERLNVSDAEIIMNYRNIVYSFYVSIAFALICFLAIVYNLFIAVKIVPALSALAILAVCLGNAFKFSFRAFQIKHQKLCSVKDWWDRATEWFPKLP